jgi:hypothetical protein
MKLLPIRLTAIFIAPFLLCSCLSLLIPAHPRRVPYDEAAFAPYGRSGSGTVSGHVNHHPKDNSTWVVGPAVHLLPDNAYTEEEVARLIVGGENLQHADPRAKKYEREAQIDPNGNFAFHGVPPGKYVVACQLTYDDGVFDQTNDDGSFTLVPLTGYQWVYARVTVKNGQAARVENWHEGQ